MQLLVLCTQSTNVHSFDNSTAFDPQSHIKRETSRASATGHLASLEEEYEMLFVQRNEVDARMQQIRRCIGEERYRELMARIDI
jgi:hypothetical protein